MNDTVHIDIDENDLDDSYAEHSRRSASFSIFILIIFIVIGIRLLSPTTTVSTTTENYQMECTIVSVNRGVEGYSMLVEGYHNDELEQHEITITKHEFMTYKEGQFVTLNVSASNQCRIVN